MRAYFVNTGHKCRGRPITTFPVVIHKDLLRLSEQMVSLKTSDNLNEIRSIAMTEKNRKPFQWKSKKQLRRPVKWPGDQKYWQKLLLLWKGVEVLADIILDYINSFKYGDFIKYIQKRGGVNDGNDRKDHNKRLGRNKRHNFSNLLP